MKNVCNILFFIFTVFAIFSSCGRSNDDFVKKVALEANKECPKRIDELTIMDSIVARPGNKLIYYYTITGDIPKSITKETFSNNMKNVLINTINSNILIKPLTMKNVIFIHHYNDKEGKFFSEVEITPEDYKKNK